MASQKQSIDDSSIEHSNVQQNQTGRDAVSFQNSHDNQVIIENNLLKLSPQSDRAEVDWDWGMKLLQQKQLPEIRKRLTDTLGRDRILMDVSIEEQQNWVNRSPLAADRTLQINSRDCGTLNANKMLIETFGRDDIEGKLLILGAPGAGKTTSLLSLAEQLVCGAISHPKTVIPVIFELSTWRNDNQSIESWLVEQLYDLHGGNPKSKLYEKWLDRQVLLPLMDGLDELGLARQSKCTQKLNEFAAHYPQLVVCCRVKEFETVDMRLSSLRGAVCLQLLSDSQIQHYFESLQRPELWEAIQTKPDLQDMLKPNSDGDTGLLRVPLFLKLMADVYDSQQPISSKADLLDKYIDRQLSFDKRERDRRKELNNYKWAYRTAKLEPDWKKTRSRLNWIARNLQVNNKVEFPIEHLQPNSIDTKISLNRYFRLYVIVSGLVDVFAFGTFGYALGNFTHSILIAIVYILINVIFFSRLVNRWVKIELVESFIMPLSSENHQYISAIFKYWIAECLSSPIKVCVTVVIFSLCLGLIVGLFEYKDLVFHSRGLIIAFLSIIATIGIIQSQNLFIWLIAGLKRKLKHRLYPNQGIWKSLLNSVMITIMSFFVLKLFSSLISGESSIFYINIPIITGITFGGGQACLQHLSLRIVLWQSGLPWNFARFLNYCVERRLLLCVGGSYRFLHRELLDHFAQSNYTN